MMVGAKPKPASGTAMARTAAGGKVWPIAASDDTIGSNSRPTGRVTNRPAATPIVTEISDDISTSPMCASIRLRKLSRA